MYSNLLIENKLLKEQIKILKLRLKNEEIDIIEESFDNIILVPRKIVLLLDVVEPIDINIVSDLPLQCELPFIYGIPPEEVYIENIEKIEVVENMDIIESVYDCVIEEVVNDVVNDVFVENKIIKDNVDARNKHTYKCVQCSYQHNCLKCKRKR